MIIVGKKEAKRDEGGQEVGQMKVMLDGEEYTINNYSMAMGNKNVEDMTPTELRKFKARLSKAFFEAANPGLKVVGWKDAEPLPGTFDIKDEEIDYTRM